MGRISFSKFLRTFLIKKQNLAILSIILIFQIIIYFTIYYKTPLYIFPNDKSINVSFYNDSIDNGHSVIEKQIKSDTLLSMSFTLKHGFVRPYVGMALSFPDKKTFDISAYNQIKLDVEGQNLETIVIYLNVENDTIDKLSKRWKTLFFGRSIEISGHRKNLYLYLNSFKIPDWWYDVSNFSPNQHFEADWKKIIAISITTGLTPDTDTRRTLTVHSISFIRNNIWLVIKMGLVFLIIFCLMFIFQYLSFSQNSIIIKYQPVEINPPSDKQFAFLNYINNNFNNPDLNLDIISKNTGFSHRKISESIANQYNCNVKTYINRIRINEAIRLLKETDLNISEIAYKVGFSSPSNFNRVFKFLTDKTPSDFINH